MLAAIVIEGVAWQYGLLHTVLAAVLATTCLEIGYLVGVAARHLMIRRPLRGGNPGLAAIAANRRRA
jgi:hypothetical protein